MATRKIIIGETIFDEAAYPITSEPSVWDKQATINGTKRETIRLTISATYAEVAELFVNNVQWIIRETTINEDGIEETTDYDKSEFSLAGDIVDHRDGRITVYMAIPTDVEKLLPVLDDATAITVPTLYPSYTVGVNYTVDDRICYEDQLYRVVQAHRSQENWIPSETPALYTPIADPSIEYPEWVQPTGSHDSYSLGAKVTHNSKKYVSDIDANTYEPGVYGWTEV